MTRDGTTIEPAQLIKEMVSPEFTQDRWREMLSSWKLDPDFPLDPWEDPRRKVAGTS